MLNGSPFNSIPFNGSGEGISSFDDVKANIRVNTNPDFATFSEVPGQISVSEGVSSEISGSISVSDYKWLTNTLKAAQQGPGYRPYYTCKIVDDTIVPNQSLSDEDVSNGQAVTAPDGSVLTVGFDSMGNLKLWKSFDRSQGLGTSTGISATCREDLNAAVAVSDWVNGSYVVDVYAFKDNGPDLEVAHFRSTDGGSSFSNPYSVQATSILVSTMDNLYVAAGKPMLAGNGVMLGSFFYIKKDSIPATGLEYYDVIYQTYTGGSSFNGPYAWGGRSNPQDFVIHSLDVSYRDGAHHIVLSAYHTLIETVPNENYGLYECSVRNLYVPHSPTSNESVMEPFWSITSEVLVSTSTDPRNLNSFTYPRITEGPDGYFVLCKAVIVEGISTATTGQQNAVTTQVYRYLLRSRDLKRFSYPAPLVMEDGVIFSDDKSYSFVLQGSNGYVVGNGEAWQYTANNIVADVTDSVISYSVSEMAGAAFQLTLLLANMNSRWVGPNPTEPGAAAIAKDMKIYVEQGYYNQSGVGEAVPRNVFFIDDIRQQVTANNNVVQIVARDAIKSLKILTSKFSYTFRGPSSYSDIFGGNTIGNWNQVVGEWSESGGELIAADNGDIGVSSMISLNDYLSNRDSYVMSACVKMPTDADDDGCSSSVYALYIDQYNWFAVHFYKVGSSPLTVDVDVSYFIDGMPSPQVLFTQTLPTSGAALSGKYVPVLIRQYDYMTFDIVIGQPSDDGNTLGCFDPRAFLTSFEYPVALTPAAGGSFDMNELFFPGQKFLNSTVALGSSGRESRFRYFKYIQSGDSQSIQEAIETLGTLAGVDRFYRKKVFADYMTDLSDYTGSPVLTKYGMRVDPSSLVLNSAHVISDGDIEVKARVSPTDGSSDYGITIAFRAQGLSGTDDRYRVVLKKTFASLDDQNNFGVASFRLYKNGTGFSGDNILVQTTIADYGIYGNGIRFTNPIDIDLTQENVYKVVMVDNYFYFFVNGTLVLAWQDNNTDVTGVDFSEGYFGIETDSNSTVFVTEISSNAMWNQLDSVSVNPGDDVHMTAKTSAGMVGGWTFTDIMGRLTSIKLDPSDLPTYTYRESVYSQSVDDSDKEYANQVTVVGNGVVATYQDKQSIALTGRVREIVVSDFKILTYEDALNRAKYEMVNNNRFISQQVATAPMNVGAEVFDAVEMVNTGDNSTGTDGTYRTYNQKLGDDGSRGRYSIEIQAGSP